MKRSHRVALSSAVLVGVLSAVGGAQTAPTFNVGIGVRETNWVSPVVIGGNGGQAGSIEWVGAKATPSTGIIPGKPLVADGTWQDFTFTFGPGGDNVYGFVGNGVIDGTNGTFEHIAFQNTPGVADPITLYIDNVVNTPAGGSATIVENWENGTVGAPSGSNAGAIMFANAFSSGSTQSSMVNGANTVNVTDVDPGEGTKSYQLNMRFVDSSATRWCRISSFGGFTPTRPNPAITYAAGSTLSFRLKAVVTPVPQGWNVDADGDWSLATNWLGSIPNSSTAIARFGGAIAITAPRTVTVDAALTPVTVAGMVFTSDFAYTINASPGNGILLRTGAGFDTQLNAERGSHTINADMETGSRLAVNVTRAADVLTINGRILTTDLPNITTAAKALDLVKNGAGTADVSKLSFDVVSVNAGRLRLKDGGGTTELYGLGIAGTPAAPTAKFDIGNNPVVIDYGTSAVNVAFNTNQATSAFADHASRIVAAYNAGAWDGNGITSSAMTSARAIGIAEAASLGIVFGATWNGAPVDETAVLIRLTLKGDATLDGTVNFDDLLKLAANYNSTTGMTWAQGDANYDGAVNFDDLLQLAANYNQSMPATLEGDWALALSSVPEPTSLLAIAGAGVSLLGRRRRK